MLQSILERTRLISDKHEKVEEVAGTGFNIFSILGVESSEVKTHSRILIELLDPKGSHKMQSAFLEMFCKRCCTELNWDKARVKAEKFIGPVSIDKTKGGSIDIFITDGKNVLAIENKIYTGEGDNQLNRYKNYLEQYYPKSHKLIFLTLYGDGPKDKELLNDKNQFQCISYEKNILDWLYDCRGKAVETPILRETITQYIHTIKSLTNQSNNEMKVKEIVDEIAKNESNIEPFFDLRKGNVFHEFKVKLLNDFKEQMEEVAKELGLESDFQKEFGLISDPTYLTFFFENSAKRFCVRLCFCTLARNLVLQVDCDKQFREQYKEQVLNALPPRSNGFNEIWVQWFEDDLRNWESNPKPWTMIKDGSLKKNIETKFEEIINKGLKKVIE